MFVTQRIQQTIKEHRIRLSWGPDGLIPEGAHLHILPEAEVEGYSTMAHGHMLPLRLGAFSYSHSVLPLDARVGRFCSIAPNVTQMGDRHPTDRISSSPITYDRDSNYMISD